MPEPDMSFQTSVKAKLPPGMVFPVSHLILQEKLSEVPQKTDVRVGYYYFEMTDRRLQKTKMGKSNRLKNSVKPVIEARFTRSQALRTSNAWQEDDSSMNEYTKDQWKMSIHAVSVSQLQIVREWLDTGGYAKIRDWFIENNKFAGRIGSRVMSIGFKNEKIVTETHDSY